MLPVLAVLASVAACGRIGFDPTSAGGDGGSDGGGGETTLLPDASFGSRTWQVRPDMSAPGGLRAPEAVYDSVRQRVIIYGGEDASGLVAEMWAMTATSWTRLCGPCAPGPRMYHALGYDPIRDRILLYGGQTSGGAVGDLWEYDGATWAAIPGPHLPGPREMVSFVFHEQKQEMFLVGGGNTGAWTSDLFAYEGGSTWTPIPNVMPRPPAIGGPGTSVTYDLTRGIVALTEQGNSNPAYDDLWAWNDVWTPICVDCTGMKRSSASVVYDRALHVSYIMNGYPDQGSNEIAGTWRVDAVGVTTMASPDPPDRDSSGVVYDRARDLIVLVGGNGGSCNGDCDETWELVPQ